MSQVVGDIRNAIIEGDQDKAISLTKKALSSGTDPFKIINDGLVAGLTEVGNRFEKTEMFLPELILAGEVGKACTDEVEKAILSQGKELQNKGKIILGTVNGDIHDIGKNIVASIFKAHGFKVIDIGKDIPAHRFIEAAQENEADIIACSALMSITRAGAREVVELLEELKIREQFPVVVGGGSIDQGYADEIGADGYADDAHGAVMVVEKLINKKRNKEG